MGHIWMELVKIVGDPVSIVFLLVIGALLLAIRQLFKIIDRKDKLISEWIEQLGENSKTLTKLTTLIEILVYGRGNKND